MLFFVSTIVASGLAQSGSILLVISLNTNRLSQQKIPFYQSLLDFWAKQALSKFKKNLVGLSLHFPVAADLGQPINHPLILIQRPYTK